ncbi:MAG: PAS domain S-box protein [Anaerolineae bacterium]|nr:PAS domain S-box protein [Anaerolineae bacterium]
MHDDLALRERVAQLEEQVSTCTAALAETRAQLEQAVAERKQAEAEQERLLAAERAQTRRQIALVRLSAELAATLDETQVCWRVVQGLWETLGYDVLALLLLDETTGDRVVAAHIGYQEIPVCIPPGRGLSELPLLDGELHYTPDVTRASRYYPGACGSEVDVPIRINGEVLAVLSAEHAEKDAFKPEDFDLLTAAAHQAGLALEKARLMAAERRRADELDALRTTMADITAELELPSLLRAIVERAAGLLGGTGGELGLYDEASQQVRIVVSHNLGEGLLGTCHALGEGAMGRVAETRQPLIISDYHTWDARAPQYADIHIRAIVAVPLVVGSRLVGVITIATTEPDRQFGPADLHLLNLFAQQAAITIENARLFEAEQRRAEQFRVIGEVGRHITSIMAVDRLLDEIARLLKRNLGYYLVGIALIEGDELVFKAGAGAVWETPEFQPPRLKVGQQGITGWVAQTGQPLLVPDLSQESRYYSLPEASEMRSELAVPLKAKETVIGVLHVQSNCLNAFDESDLVLLQSLAHQAAIAIENARLYAQAQREIAERVRAEAELRTYQEHLEDLVSERTARLRESEERYRTLFDGVPIGIYRSTPGGQMVDANPALVEMLGYPSREALLATNTPQLYLDPEERVGWTTLMDREGVVRDYEAPLQRYDGEVIWVRNTARAVKDEQGEVLHYEGSLEDVTERKRAEAELRRYHEHLEELVEERAAELRQSEERYHTLFEGVPLGLYRAIPEGQLIDVNPALVAMLGYPSREALLAVNIADLSVDHDERARWAARMRQEGLVRDFEIRLRRYDGEVIWVSDTARALRDEQGQALYFEGSAEDITERKRFEEELRRQKEYFEALFVNSPVAALTANLESDVVSWNPMAERVFGYTPQEAMGRNVNDLVAKDPTIREEALHCTEMVLTEGGAEAITKRSRKDGSLVDVHCQGFPVTVSGEMVGYIITYHDISELQLARRTAEAANQAKSRFLANMSHELRTPLNAILGFTQLMGGDPNLTAEQRQNLGIINRSGEHLLALINDVLEMSKIEAGRVALQEKSFDLYRLLDTLEEMFRLRAERKGLALSFERSENVPQYVEADEGKLRQVLMNLLGNAVKFTEQGGVALRVAKVEDHLLIEVADSGPGIAPEELNAVFEPFVQTASGQRSLEGTGLGLSISRQFARLMGGDITVRSELGQGSVFRFEAPIGLADTAEAEAAQPSRKVLGVAPGQGVFRLLIVDDRETSRQLLVKLLEPLGFALRQAVHGREAIEVWEQWEPHLIWMDMRMPVMDGYQATRRIRASAKGRETVIVALTASAFEDDRETIMSAGCDDIVRKPFRTEEILDKLTQHLGVRYVYADEPSQPAPTPPATTRDALAPAALAALPASWLTQLQQATIRANLDQVLALTEQVRAQNAALADALADLANGFEYKAILNLIDQAGGER